MTTFAESNIYTLIQQCDEILDGCYGDETQREIDNLMCEMEGFGLYLIATRSQGIPNDRTVNGVRRARGWLKANMASLAGIKGETTINATASSNVSVSIENVLSQTVGSIEGAGFPNAEAERIKAEILDVMTADKSSPEVVSDKIGKLLGHAKTAAEIARIVLPFVGAYLSGNTWQ